MNSPNSVSDPDHDPRGERIAPQPCRSFLAFENAPGYCQCGWMRHQHSAPALRFAPVGAPEAAIVGKPFGATNVPPTGAARLLSDLAPEPDPFLGKLGGMIQRANARLGLDAKGNPINAGADGRQNRPQGTVAESTAPSADAKHANPRRATVIATLCPVCGEPMTHEDRQTSEDADGRCFEVGAAGWGCECGYSVADE